MIVFLFSEDLSQKSRLHGCHDVAEGDIKKNFGTSYCNGPCM